LPLEIQRRLRVTASSSDKRWRCVATNLEMVQGFLNSHLHHVPGQTLQDSFPHHGGHGDEPRIGPRYRVLRPSDGATAISSVGLPVQNVEPDGEAGPPLGRE
jgi:hypothetical protein